MKRTCLGFMALLLAACETSGPIGADDSMMTLGLEDWPEITRELELLTYRRIERWDWQGGSLYALRSPSDRYWAEDFAEPEDLIQMMREWGQSVPAGFGRRSVYENENRNGTFQYAVVRRGTNHCFHMLQPIPYQLGTRYDPAPESQSSEGYVYAFHCAATSVAKVEDRGLEFAQALVRNW